MRKYTLFITFLFLVLCGQTAFCSALDVADNTAAQNQTQTVSKSSLAATRVDSKLNETVLHKSVLDYSLPPEIAAVSKKCAAGEVDECYFSFKSFENAPDVKLAAAANV